MLEAGALDEVSSLLQRGLDPSLPAMKALGMVELGAAVRGEMPLDEALSAAQQATRRFAKRQITWFRNRFDKSMAIDAQLSESFIEIFIRKILHSC